MIKQIADKLIKFLYKNKIYFISFFGLFILQVFIYLLLNTINGPENFLIGDLKEQYASLFSYYRDVLLGNESLSFSFKNGLGSSMFGTFAYYLSSPLNLICMFFPQSEISNALFIIAMIKVSLCGPTMYAYLKYQFKKTDKWLLLMFSTCYAFMAYNVCYSIHLMWIDVVYLAPLVLLGIDKLINGEKPVLYIITLTLALICNYYIAYMLCIFVVIYFIYKILIKYKIKKDFKTILNCLKKFIICSLLGAFIGAVILIPTAIELIGSSKSNTNIFSSGINIDFNIFKVLGMLLLGQNNGNNTLNVYNFYIYCGIIVLPLIMLYFLNKKIKKREKILSLSVLIIFILSFSINVLDNVWHGMNIPICYEGRYTFLLAIFLIYLSTVSIVNIKYINKKQYLYVGITIPVLLIIVLLLKTYLSNIYILLVSFILFILYLLLLSQFKSNYKQSKLLIIFLVVAELTFNYYICLKEYVRNVDIIEETNNKYYEKQMKKLNKHNYERIENLLLDTRLDSFSYNYSGTWTFLSTINPQISSLYNKLGYLGQSNLYENIYSTYLTDSIFNVKYKIEMYNNLYDEINKFTKIYLNKKEKISSTTYPIYENNYNLGLGFLTTDQIKYYDNIYKEQEKLSFQNDLFKTLTDSKEDILSKQNFDEINKYTYEFLKSKDETYYLSIDSFNYIKHKKNAKINIYVNNQLIGEYNPQNMGVLLIDSNEQEDKKITIRIEPKNCFDIKGPYLYKFNQNVFKKAIKNTQNRAMEIKSFSDTYIKASVDVTNYKTLFTSIPYDKGWTVYVDGKKTKINNILNCFIGVELEKGKHLIEFKYHTPGLKIGIIISVISLLITIVYLKKQKKTKKKLSKK